MLRVDLVRLGREGELQVEGVMGPDDPLLRGSRIRFVSPLRVKLQATLAGSGEVVVRGNVQGSLEQECRRCLVKLTPSLDTELTLVFAPADELGEDQAGDVYPLEADAMRLDVGEAIREELLLTVPAYEFCSEDCKGFCSGCGANLNEEECRCTTEGADPRWDVLRTLGNE